jgi:hypothetical protein
VDLREKSFSTPTPDLDSYAVCCFDHPAKVVFGAMPIHDLAVAYQTKTDEELLHLVGSPEQKPTKQAKTSGARRRLSAAGRRRIAALPS